MSMSGEAYLKRYGFGTWREDESERTKRPGRDSLDSRRKKRVTWIEHKED